MCHARIIIPTISEGANGSASEPGQEGAVVTIQFSLSRGEHTFLAEIKIPYEKPFGEQLLQRWPFAGFHLVLARDQPVVIKPDDTPCYLHLSDGDRIDLIEAESKTTAKTQEVGI